MFCVEYWLFNCFSVVIGVDYVFVLSIALVFCLLVFAVFCILYFYDI